MNFEEVIACLQNTDKREEFIARLKNAGKQSTPFLNLQSAMTELKMHKTARGIDQKTTIQHTLRFSDVDDCFQKYRLVCKSWKDTVETIRFNRFVGVRFCYDLDHKINEGILLNPNYFGKYLKSFRKLNIPLDLENKNEIFSLVLNNMKKLNKISFAREYAILGEEYAILGEEYDSFAFQILQNSHETLRVLDLSKLIIPDIGFPQLTNLDLAIGEHHIFLQEFQAYFPQVLKNMKNLEKIELGLYSSWQCVGEYICENYSKQCISASRDTETLSIMPVKILEHVHDVNSFENKKYISHLQYAHVWILNPERPMSDDTRKFLTSVLI